MTVYGSLSNVAVAPDWIYLIGGYRNIYYREPLVTYATPFTPRASRSFPCPLARLGNPRPAAPDKYDAR